MGSYYKTGYKVAAIGADGFPVFAYPSQQSSSDEYVMIFVKCNNADCSLVD